MKQFITLLFVALIAHGISFAQAPSVPSSDLKFTNMDGNRFTGTYTKGGGLNRIVVVRQGGPVTGLPVDDREYTANGEFGTPASAFTVAGEFVVAKTNQSSFTVTKLTPGTTYHVAIFEYNGTGANAKYLKVPLTGDTTTVVAPTGPTHGISKGAVTGNTITLNWQKGTGDSRLILARKGAPVNATPEDLTSYLADPDFGGGTKLGTDNFAVYRNSGTSTQVKSLEPNTTYHFAFFEFNGNNGPMYLVPGATFSATTNAGPSQAPGNMSFSNVEGNRYRITIAPGNGNRRMIIAKKGSAVTAIPVNNGSYSPNGSFGTPASAIKTDEYVVHAGAGNQVDITNLEPNTTYHFRAYEYDEDAAGNTYFLTSSYSLKSGPTASTPANIVTGLNLKSISGRTATVTFTQGSGSGQYRMVIAKAGSPVDAIPEVLKKYTSVGNNFGSGSQITPGNWCIVAAMNGSQFNINNLDPGVRYYISVYEFNGTDYPVYSASGATFDFVMPNEPTQESRDPVIQLREGNSFRLLWTKGNGARRVVIARKGNAVTAQPVDQETYIGKDSFGLGQAIKTDEYVVYDGTEQLVDLKNLDIGATYHFAIFEYNVGTDGKTDYLVSKSLATTAATFAWPTQQPAITQVSPVQATQATVNYTAGNGAGRIFIMRKGADVNVTPQDLEKYQSSTVFGSSSSHIGDGNYVVNITSFAGSFIVTGLEANTTYYVKGFEMNGNNAPAYLRTAPASISFTTSDEPGATVPTQAAHTPEVKDIDGNKLTLKWTNGDGERRLVIMRAGAAVTFQPVAGVSYTYDSEFGKSPDLGGGQYTVYNSTGNSVEITNLQPATTYHFTVYEFNGTGSLIRYLTSSVLAGTAGTASIPVTPVSGVQATPGVGSLTIAWTAGSGSGAGRLVVVKEGSAIMGTPAALSVYTPKTAFKAGAQIAVGEYSVFSGAGNAVTVTGLEANKTYHYSIFEFNGSAAPVYNTTGVVSGQATLAGTLPIRLLYFRARQSNGNVLLTWATAQEVNNASFTIERSHPGGTFEAIKTLPGALNSDRTIEYNYTDDNVPTGTGLYRIKQTDLDGRFTYTPVVTVKVMGADNKVQLSPNPVQGQFRLDWQGAAKKGTLIIYDLRGMPVKQQPVVAGQWIAASDLKPGAYYLVIQSGSEQFQTRLIKQ